MYELCIHKAITKKKKINPDMVVHACHLGTQKLPELEIEASLDYTLSSRPM